MSLANTGPLKLETAPVSPEKEFKKPSLWQSWHIASLMIAVAISFVGAGLVAPLRTLYARSEGASGGEVGLMGAAYLFSSFVFLFPFGWLSDRFSRVGLIVAGLTAHAIITLGYLPLTTGESFVALRFVEGIAGAAVLPAARALLMDLVPPGRNGEAFGLLGAMMTFGMFAGPPAGSFLAASFGYTAAYWLAALAYLPAAALVVVAFRRYRHPQKTRLAATGSANQEVKASLWTKAVVIGCLVKLAMGLGPGMGMTIWSLYLADLGYPLALIGWTYTVYAVPMVLIGPRAGRFSDRYGRLGLMLGGGVVLGFLWISYGWITSFVVFMGLGIIEGVFDAIARSANDGYLADQSPAESQGRAQGIFTAIGQMGSLLGALGAGFLYEGVHSLTFAILGGVQVLIVLSALGLNMWQPKASLNFSLKYKKQPD